MPIHPGVLYVLGGASCWVVAMQRIDRAIAEVAAQPGPAWSLGL
jgi:hypothetical protein